MKLPGKSAHVELVAARREQEAILANLLELYAHDFSEFHDVAIGPDGRFGYRSLPLYWSEPGRHPFLVWADGALAGLVLVKRGSEFSGNEALWDMAEFFVLRGYRRRGIGTQVAHEVWKKFPGLWEVRVMETNVAGHDCGLARLRVLPERRRGLCWCGVFLLQRRKSRFLRGLRLGRNDKVEMRKASR